MTENAPSGDPRGDPRHDMRHDMRHDLHGASRQYALAAFDIDGTVLDSSHDHDGLSTGGDPRKVRMSHRTIATLERLASQDVIVVLATGRPWPATQHIAQQAAGIAYAVCLNGAVVVDARTCERVADRSMTCAEAVEAARTARRMLGTVHLGADLSDGSHAWEADFSPKMPADIELDMGIRRVDDAVEDIDGPVLTWLVEAPDRSIDSVIAALTPVLPPSVEVRASGLDMAEIAAAGVCKSTGVALVGERCGIAPEATIAFGNDVNDLDLLAWAGYSVAMDGSPVQVCAVADEIAPPCAADGVATVVERMLAHRRFTASQAASARRKLLR